MQANFRKYPNAATKEERQRRRLEQLKEFFGYVVSAAAFIAILFLMFILN